MDDYEDEGTPEIFSAQVLRRLHDDATSLYHEYAGFDSQLEDEPTKQVLARTIGKLVKDIAEIEKVFKKMHGDLPPLRGGSRHRPEEAYE
jgi:hypothetical protein